MQNNSEHKIGDSSKPIQSNVNIVRGILDKINRLSRNLGAEGRGYGIPNETN